MRLKVHLRSSINGRDKAQVRACRCRLIDEIRITTPLLVIGRFLATPDHPSFSTAGRITRPIFVFPRASVWIQNAGEDPFVADPNVVTLYNRNQQYSRAKLSDAGDHSDWFAVREDVLSEITANYGHSDGDSPIGPFIRASGPVDAISVCLERSLIRHIRASVQPDILFVEEIALFLAARVLSGVPNHVPSFPAGNARASKRQIELVEHTKALLNRNLDARLSLQTLADTVGCSPYHLCRVFRGRVGSPIHSYQNQLRMRAALDCVAEPYSDLTTVALHLGFSSHSHFTWLFRRTFGITPSYFREAASLRLIRELAARLETAPV